MTEVDPSLILRQVCNQAGLTTGSRPCSECVFVLGTREKPFKGGECNVFALQDHQKRLVCIRIYRELGPSSSYVLQNEINFRSMIKGHNIDLFQTLFTNEIYGNDLIPTPFVSLEWVNGTSLQWSDSFPATRFEREKVIRATAEASMDLLYIQKPGKFTVS